MGVLTEAAQWAANVFKIDTDTVWKGGDDGDANKQGQALANRTSWLKAQVEDLALAISNLFSAQDLQKASAIASNAGGTADAITGVFSPAIAALTHGMTLYVRAASANATTTPTFTPNSGTIAAKTIVKGNGLALASGDIAGTGHWIKIQYDETLGKWVLINPATGVSVATSTNDASFADASVKPASTGWVRGAMNSICTAAGFAASLTSNGYIKFPSWLGGLIIQWGSVQSANINTTVANFPIAFPNNCFQVVASGYNVSGGVEAFVTVNSPSGLTSASFNAFFAGSPGGPLQLAETDQVRIQYIAFGK